jgi:CMP-N-acetylneuraminic acid synthetase
VTSVRALGIIPGRGGSKGVRRKNIRLVAREPLITYAIHAAQANRLLTTFLTTTDDDEIAHVASRAGSPILRRPPELAQDDTPMVPVVLHALEHAERGALAPYDAVVILQPTAPIRTGGDIDAVIAILEEDPPVESVVSVCRMDDMHPARMYRPGGDGWMKPLWSEWETTQRQELPVVYYRNGAVYAVRRSVLVERRMVMSRCKKAHVMPREFLANFDDERDLVIADLLMRLWKEGRL